MDISNSSNMIGECIFPTQYKTYCSSSYTTYNTYNIAISSYHHDHEVTTISSYSSAGLPDNSTAEGDLQGTERNGRRQQSRAHLEDQG
jgi:hypothetical protein